MNDGSAIACTLSETALDAQVNFISQEVLSGVSAIVELEDGYELQFPGDERWIRKLTDLIVAERECCTFFQIEMILLPNRGAILLRLRGENGIKEQLQGLFAL